MIRSFAVMGAVGLLVIGCVTISPAATDGPSEPPSDSTPTPIPATAIPTATSAPISTPSPTAALTSPPTAEPTADATFSPEPLPSAASSPSPVENYGAHTPLFDDQMEDPNSGWGVGTNEGGSVSYADGDLEITAAAGGAWVSTSRLTGSTDNAVHVEGIYTPTGSGYMGLLCGERDDELWGAMANLDNGDYSFIKLGSSGTTILAASISN